MQADLVFDGIVDAEGNLYYRQCGRSTALGVDCVLLSVDRDGAQRWLTSVGILYGSPVMVEDRLVLLEASQPAGGCAQALLQARSPQDGHVLWSRDLVELMGPQSFPNQCPAFLGTVPAAGPVPGTVVAAADAYTPWTATTGTYARYFVVSLADGAPLQVKALRFTSPGGGAAIHLDEAGNAYGDDIDHTRSLAPDGTLRWDVKRDFVGFVSAAWRGTVIVTGLDGLAIMSASDGRVIARFPEAGAPLVDANGVTWVAHRGGHATLVHADPATGEERWARAISPASESAAGDPRQLLSVSDPVATSAGTYLVVTQHWTETGFRETLRRTYDPAVLREFDRGGQELSEVPLAGSGAAGTRFTLRNGQIAFESLDGSTAILRVYEVGGLNVAPDGWVAEHGNMQRDLHAR